MKLPSGHPVAFIVLHGGGWGGGGLGRTRKDLGTRSAHGSFTRVAATPAHHIHVHTDAVRVTR